MSVMGINEDHQYNILSIVAGVLHLGNINFVEQGNYAVVQDPQCMFVSVAQKCKMLLCCVSSIVCVQKAGYFATLWL